jgi:hypothetical protein
MAVTCPEIVDGCIAPRAGYSRQGGEQCQAMLTMHFKIFSLFEDEHCPNSIILTLIHSSQ